MNAWAAFWQDREARFRRGEGPLRGDALRQFAGLDVFPHDPTLVFTAALHPAPERAPVAFTGGDEREMALLGEAHFERGGEEHRLLLFAAAPGRAFVPFADTAPGAYAMRYLEPEFPGTGAAGDTVTLDFNFAYAPHCAHAPEYSCPIPPAQNRLPFAVTAGERTGVPASGNG